MIKLTTLTIALSLAGASLASAQTIVYNDGSQYSVKGTERVLVVPKDTPRVLYTHGQKVKLRNPKPSLQGPAPVECSEGGLVIGSTPPCPERELSLGD